MKEFSAIKFVVQIRTASFMFQLYNIIREKHGKMDKIILYDTNGNPYDEARKDDSLRDLFGIKGAATKETAETVKVQYDFRPCNINDPVLLT